MEIVPITEMFPHPTPLLCHFHVLKAVNRLWKGLGLSPCFHQEIHEVFREAVHTDVFIDTFIQCQEYLCVLGKNY